MKYLKNKVSLGLNHEKCIGCSVCVEVCPHGVFGIKNKKAFIIDKDACMECSACQMNCAFDAISVNSGVGCAQAVYYGLIHNTEPSCDCSKSNDSCC